MISVDIGNKFIRIIDVKANKKEVSIQKYIEVPTAGDFMDSDFNLDIALFKNALKEGFAKIPSKDVILTFSCLPHVSNVLVLPYEKNEAIMSEMVKGKVYQTLSPKEYIMDYRIVNTFKEENVEKCTAMVFMAPRNLVQDARDCVLSLDKNPKGFMIVQNCIYDFAQRYLNGKTVLVVHVGQSKLDAHLINFPDNIITRTTSLEASKEIDVLFSASESPQNKNVQLEDIVSKLQQYQAIKYPQRPIEACYLIGEDANAQCKADISAISSIPMYLVNELNLPVGSKQQELNNLVYAVGACINAWG